MNTLLLKVCDICGEQFVARSSRQHSCNKTITRICPVCGHEYTTSCSKDMRATCPKPECKKMSSHIIKPTKRICKACGGEFVATNPRQVYCREEKKSTCPVCGKTFTNICGVTFSKTCSTECQTQLIMLTRSSNLSNERRICKWCGSEFIPKETRDVYCYQQHYKDCIVCGQSFEIDPRYNPDVETCSKKCKITLMTRNHDYVKGAETLSATLQTRYGVTNAALVPSAADKMKRTCLERYGKKWYTQTDEYKEQAKKTNIEKYGVEYHLQSPVVIEKRMQTCQDKYGSPNIFSSEIGKELVKEGMLSKYGVTNPSQYAEFKKRATANARNSKLEERICRLLDNYNIEYMHHYFVQGESFSHEFDFYLPKYKILVDADGLYYHSYLDDPDGERVRDDYDERRMCLIPEDHLFYAIIEGQEDRQVKELVEFIEKYSGSLAEYDSQLFKWCRSIEFPYPEYTEKRLLSDWNHLRNYSNSGYISRCRIGISLIKQFHRSIYECHRKENVSPLDGWNDDELLKKVIRNRFIYKNDVDPSKILSGFTVSRIAPCVSMFNPVLAKYLVTKYLNEFDSVFDPFSGFSGRLLGVTSANKQYIGQDLNEKAVVEANKIVDFLNLNSRAQITTVDILQSHGNYECLLTCPPYHDKEIYNTETTFKSCDDWIDECLQRFDCRRYVFVVDKTEKYKDKVVEELKNDSHFNTNSEYVLVIDC